MSTYDPDALPERIRERFVSNDETGCWEWVHSRTGNGYARLSWGGTTTLGHRVTYQLLVGPIPGGLEIDHTCRVRCCVNPAHLELVSHAVNMARAVIPRKTHCPHGHAYVGDNVMVIPRGERRTVHRCRTCKNGQRRAQRVAA